MSRPRWRDSWRLLLVQASWNRRDMQGLGWWFIRDISPREKDPLGLRHSNTQPHLAGLVLGALERLEEDPARAAQLPRLADVLGRALGGVGDRWIWMGWMPTFHLLALLLFCFLHGPAGPRWVLGLWAVGAIGLFWLRGWTWRRGHELGESLPGWLKESGFSRIGDQFARVGLLLSGALSALLLLWLAESVGPEASLGYSVPIWLGPLAALMVGMVALRRRVDPLRLALAVALLLPLGESIYRWWS